MEAARTSAGEAVAGRNRLHAYISCKCGNRSFVSREKELYYKIEKTENLYAKWSKVKKVKVKK